MGTSYYDWATNDVITAARLNEPWDASGNLDLNGSKSLGTAAVPIVSLSLDNAATDGGAIYFDAGTTYFLKGSAAGPTLTIGGFTALTASALATITTAAGLTLAGCTALTYAGTIATPISIALDNGVTDSGAVYFDAGTTKFIKGNAAGTQLGVGGFTSLISAVNDITSLGVSGTAWSDLFLASGAVIDFNAGDITLTHSSNDLLLAGGSFSVTTSSGGGIGFAVTSVTLNSRMSLVDPRIYTDGTGNDLYLATSAGYVAFGTYAAGAATDSTGYITIKDAAGNTRKLMVQA